MYRVIGSEEFNKQFDSLQERAKGGDSESTCLVKIIGNGVEKLRFDYKYGSHIAKEKIPPEYAEKFGAKNLWKLNLSKFWRLIYTVRGTEIEVMSVLLEVLDHRQYNRKFGYKAK